MVNDMNISITYESNALVSIAKYSTRSPPPLRVVKFSTALLYLFRHRCASYKLLEYKRRQGTHGGLLIKSKDQPHIMHNLFKGA